jgi:HD-GYP domain-containing protein (c-di-GMP phosphodiesterase class II)
MRESGGNLLEHSINVAIIALCIGHKYRLPAHEMRQLGLGALNYDIGMLAVPSSIIEKQSELTDEERLLLQQHTTYGFLMLKGNPEIPPTSAIVALSHHEFQDGSGFPQSMTAENRPPLKDFSHQGCIHRFAQIVAVADTYDMLIHGRMHFQQRLDPLHAAKKMVELSKTKLNTEIVKTLLSIFPVYPLGARIKIVHGPIADLDNAIGAISKVYPDHIASPQITIFESARHFSFPKPIVLELAQYKGFSLELLN